MTHSSAEHELLKFVKRMGTANEYVYRYALNGKRYILSVFSPNSKTLDLRDTFGPDRKRLSVV